MPHPLHSLVKQEFEKLIPHRTNFELLKDQDCGGEQRLPFFISKSKSSSTRISNVDLFVSVNRKIKLVCEIDESNIKPGHIFGKFLSMISTDCCILEDGSKYIFDENLIFVQVLSKDKLKGNSKKEEQWRKIEESIQNNFRSFKDFTSIEYHIIVGDKISFDSSKLNSILQSIH